VRTAHLYHFHCFVSKLTIFVIFHEGEDGFFCKVFRSAAHLFAEQAKMLLLILTEGDIDRGSFCFRYYLFHSSLFVPLVHHFTEILEEVVRVVRAGGGLGVILHAEHGVGVVLKAGAGLVVEIDMRDGDVVAE